MGIDDDGLGEQPQQGFSSDHALDAYSSLYGLVLMSYGYCCALTGARFAPPTLTLHPDLAVEAIQPRDEGGPLSIGNYVSMLQSLAGPFRSGLITMDDDYRIVVPQPQLLDRAMLGGLRTTLLLPADPILRPDKARLAYHRRFALGR